MSCLLVALGGCEVFKKSEEVQNIVNRRVVGMRVGAFLDRYGPYYKRTELEDGTTVYNWISQVGPVANGQVGLDDKTCTLRFTADKGGRIVAVDVAVDNPGHVSLSRCGEIFAAAP